MRKLNKFDNFHFSKSKNSILIKNFLIFFIFKKILFLEFEMRIYWENYFLVVLLKIKHLIKIKYNLNSINTLLNNYK